MTGRAPARRRSLLVVGGVALLLALGVVLRLWWTGGGDDVLAGGAGRESQGVVGRSAGADATSGGPLVSHGPVGYLLPRRPPGRGLEFTDTFEILMVGGRSPITLLGVESVGVRPDDGDPGRMRLLDARLAGPDRADTFQFFPRLSPLPRALGPLEDAVGARLGPTRGGRSRGYPLVLSYRAGGSEPVARAGLRVSYEAGGREYVRELPSRIVYCGRLRRADCEAFSGRLFPDG